VFEWVDVLERDPGLDPDAVGRLVASIHRAAFPKIRGEDPWYREPIAGRRWDELARDLRSAGAPFADELASRRDELAALAALVQPPTVLQTCHRDLWADNVRATHGGTRCVLDWENFGLADPAQELCLVLFEFGAGDAARTRAIYEAYVDGGGPGRLRGPATFSMLIAQLGHIGARGCADWLGATSEGDRAFAAAWFAEFVDEPVTIDDIEMLLDVVGA
jgi:aminoglycoside phosphotransferase (APT) family kinase protein